MYYPTHPENRQEITEKAMQLEATMLWDEEIKPGDKYLAARNVGAQLLTCKENDRVNRWIVPEEKAYLYDTNECVKVKMPKRNTYHKHQSRGLHHSTFQKVSQATSCPFNGGLANHRVTLYNRETRIYRSTEVNRGTVLPGAWEYVTN